MVSAEDLNTFAGTNESRRLLPHIVRKLLVDSPGIRGLRMPAGNGVWRSDWDGYVEHVDGNAFLPEGAQCWEMSTERRPGKKAQEDYEKRTRDSRGVDRAATTFVFATMRHWPKKLEWAQAKRAEGIWRDVRTMDSEDLWSWLESNNEVHVWASRRMGRRPRRRTSGSPVPAQLPAAARSFIGRERELERLAAGVGELTQGGLAVVSGPPGVGKTAFAVRFAHDHAANFPDGQLYVDLRGTHPDSLATDAILTRVLRAMGVSVEQRAGTRDEMAATFRSVASTKRFVVVLDNAANAAQVRLLTPGTSRSLVIVTSRDQLGGLDCAQRIHLETLSTTDAVAMLASRIGEDRAAAEPAALPTIAGLCGGLPLALQIVAHLAERSPSWRLQYLADRLGDKQSRLDRLRVGDLEVRASFQLSYELLAPGLRSAFRRICLIPGPTFNAHLAKMVLPAKKLSRAELTVEQLVDCGLVELADTDGRYRIHDLLRLFGEEKADEEDPSATRREVVADARRYLLRGVEEAGLTLTLRIDSEFAREVRAAAQPGDALIWLDDNIDNVMAVVHDAIKDGFYNPAITAIVTVSGYFELRASWVALRELALLGRAILDQVRTKGTANEEAMPFLYASMLTLLAKSANGLRNYGDALSYCDQAAAYCGANELLETIVVQNVRGLVLRSMNRQAEALAVFQDCASSWQQLGYEGQVRLVEHNIGATLMDMGQPDEALVYLQRDLAGCRASKDILGEAHTLNTIGLAWARLGKLEQAQQALVQAVLGYRDQRDHVHEGDALNDLGLVLHRQEKYDEAYQCHWLDLAYCQKRRDWHGSALALIRLADNLISKDRGYASRALTYIRIAMNYLDPEKDRRAMAAALAILGDLGYATDQVERGDRCYDFARAIYRKIGNYQGQAEVYVRQSRWMIERGDIEAAQTALRAAESLVKAKKPGDPTGDAC